MTTMLQELADSIQSPAMQNVFKITQRASNSDLGVLITGEFGVGKEWLARRMHMLSMRAGKPFISVDFSTIPRENLEEELFGSESGSVIDRGILEDVNGGTVLFGGFSSIPADIQAKVVRVAENQKFHRIGGKKEIWFNGRVVLAEKTKPTETTGHKNTYSRLAPIQIDLPPLRDRREDTLPLIHRFITISNDRNRTQVTGISSQALDLCLKYPWPGNVRELRNTVEYAVIMCQKHQIQLTHLPLQVRGGQFVQQEKIPTQRSMNVMELEKILIQNALKQTSTRKEAARMLGISIKTLYNKMHRYRLEHLLSGERGVKSDQEQDEENTEKTSPNS